MKIRVPYKLKTLTEKLLEKKSFALTTHVRPDPDGWGSELALAYLLKEKNKDVIIFNHDPYKGSNSVFLKKQLAIPVYNHEHNFDRSLLDNRTIVSLDNSDLHRLGEVSKYIKEDLSNLLVIDHHDGDLHSSKNFFQFPNASSTTEIICTLLLLSKIEIPHSIAEVLYIGLVVDNGFFSYRKTNPLSHRIATHLLKRNVKPALIAEKMKACFSFEERIAARQYMYSKLHSTENNQIAWFAVSEDELKKNNIKKDNIKGFTNELFEIKEVQIAILFTQKQNQQTRASLVSRSHIDLLPVTEGYQGGGHKTACALNIELNLESAVQTLIPLVEKCIFK